MPPVPPVPPPPPLPARPVGWGDLLAHPDVEEETVFASPVGLMAFHGGLEAGTAEIAAAVAGLAGCSLYVVRQPDDLRWHVPSHRVDPDRSPVLADWLAHVSVAISLHGYGRSGWSRRVLVGGGNRTLAASVAARLRDALPGFTVIDELERMPRELRGQHPLNPVNRPPGSGVQLELPPSARWPPAVEPLIEALAGAAAQLGSGWEGDQLL